MTPPPDVTTAPRDVPAAGVRRYDLVSAELREKPFGALVSAEDYDAMEADRDAWKARAIAWKERAIKAEKNLAMRQQVSELKSPQPPALGKEGSEIVQSKSRYRDGFFLLRVEWSTEGGCWIARYHHNPRVSDAIGVGDSKEAALACLCGELLSEVKALRKKDGDAPRVDLEGVILSTWSAFHQVVTREEAAKCFANAIRGTFLQVYAPREPDAAERDELVSLRIRVKEWEDWATGLIANHPDRANMLQSWDLRAAIEDMTKPCPRTAAECVPLDGWWNVYTRDAAKHGTEEDARKSTNPQCNPLHTAVRLAVLPSIPERADDVDMVMLEGQLEQAFTAWREHKQDTPMHVFVAAKLRTAGFYYARSYIGWFAEALSQLADRNDWQAYAQNRLAPHHFTLLERIASLVTAQATAPGGSVREGPTMKVNTYDLIELESKIRAHLNASTVAITYRNSLEQHEFVRAVLELVARVACPSPTVRDAIAVLVESGAELIESSHYVVSGHGFRHFAYGKPALILQKEVTP